MTISSYVLNDEFIFDTNTSELKSLTDANEIITLNAPTARCLQLLIEKKGEVVSRECFLNQVWHARGIVVSENTFYQNISLLRKSLKKVASTSDIVVTVRSKGFVIPESTRIHPLKAEEYIRVSHSSSEIRDEKENVFISTSPALLEPVGEKKTDPKPLTFKHNPPKGVMLLLIVFIVLEFISLIFTILKR